jgi:hypothetical protein
MQSPRRGTSSGAVVLSTPAASVFPVESFIRDMSTAQRLPGLVAVDLPGSTALRADGLITIDLAGRTTPRLSRHRPLL